MTRSSARSHTKRRLLAWRSSGRSIAYWVMVTLVAVFMAAALTKTINLPGPFALPPAALAAVAMFVAAAPLLITRWRWAFIVFFIWLGIEDLIRKFAGNAIAVYFVKDLVFAIALVGFSLDSISRGSWRAAVGRVRGLFWALFVWGLIMCVPTGLQDVRLPLLGLRLNYLYVPLVAVGYVIAKKAVDFRRWILILSVVGAAVCSLGVVQSVVGTTFLAPSKPTPGLENLVIVKKTASGDTVTRPSGPFVDAGRFSQAASLSFALSLAALVMTRGWARGVALGSTVVSAAGTFASGGRSAVVLGLAMVAVTLIAPAFSDRRPNLAKTASLVIAGVAIAGIMILIIPAVLSNRTTYYLESLDPRSPTNEWSHRWVSYGADALHGIQVGGILGKGTGQASQGKGYLYGGTNYSSEGTGSVESGYGAVAWEWGVVGLLLWLAWAATWTLRAFSSVAEARGSPIAAGGLVLAAYIAVYLFGSFYSGIQSFQNYYTNAYFWFLFGVLFALPIAAREERSRLSGVSLPVSEAIGIPA